MAAVLVRRQASEICTSFDVPSTQTIIGLVHSAISQNESSSPIWGAIRRMQPSGSDPVSAP